MKDEGQMFKEAALFSLLPSVFTHFSSSLQSELSPSSYLHKALYSHAFRQNLRSTSQVLHWPEGFIFINFLSPHKNLIQDSIFGSNL